MARGAPVTGGRAPEARLSALTEAEQRMIEIWRTYEPQDLTGVMVLVVKLANALAAAEAETARYREALETLVSTPSYTWRDTEGKEHCGYCDVVGDHAGDCELTAAYRKATAALAPPRAEEGGR